MDICKYIIMCVKKKTPKKPRKEDVTLYVLVRVPLQSAWETDTDSIEYNYSQE